MKAKAVEFRFPEYFCLGERRLRFRKSSVGADPGIKLRLPFGDAKHEDEARFSAGTQALGLETKRAHRRFAMHGVRIFLRNRLIFDDALGGLKVAALSHEVRHRRKKSDRQLAVFLDPEDSVDELIGLVSAFVKGHGGFYGDPCRMTQDAVKKGGYVGVIPEIIRRASEYGDRGGGGDADLGWAQIGQRDKHQLDLLGTRRSKVYDF